MTRLTHRPAKRANNASTSRERPGDTNRCNAVATHTDPALAKRRSRNWDFRKDKIRHRNGAGDREAIEVISYAILRPKESNTAQMHLRRHTRSER